MIGKLDPADMTKASSVVKAMRKPLLIAHTRPDCDALGALLAMRSFVRSWGGEPLAVQFSPTPPRYVALTKYEPMLVWGEDVGLDDLSDVDGVVILDTCSYKQLEPVASWLKETSLPVVAVDHHVTRDDLATALVVDDAASATCLILYEWAKSAGWPIDDVAAHSLFVGIATDTGWFSHSNTGSRTLGAAAELVQLGVSVNQVHRELNQTDSAARIRLLAHLLHGLELHADETLAVMHLDNASLDRIGARVSDTEEIINEPLRISSVLVSLLMIEQADGPVRVSFRSKVPSDSSGLDVDVASIAQFFGGGGHKRAAGARIDGSLSAVKDKVVSHVLDALSISR